MRYITLRGVMSLNFGESKVLMYEGNYLVTCNGWVGLYYIGKEKG